MTFDAWGWVVAILISVAVMLDGLRLIRKSREASEMAKFVETTILELVLDDQTDEAIEKIKTLNRTEVANLESAARWISNRCNDRYDEILEEEGSPKP